MSEIEGLFEIHISVDPSQIWQLEQYCNKNKIKKIMAVAPNGKHKNQLMISKWKNGKETDVIKRANLMTDNMSEEFNLTILRIKVEAMSNSKNVPLNENDINDRYFEYHIKYILDNNDLKKMCKHIENTNVAISRNIYTKTENSYLLTFRISGNKGFNNAEKIKDELIEKLKEKGFHSNDQIQKEYTVYDTNINLDDGWIKMIN